MFDFTQEIQLDSKNQKIYRVLQLLFYLLALFSAIYLCFLILFPQKSFNFSFSNPGAKNNLDTPRTASGNEITSGKIISEENTIFMTDILADYSKAKVSLTISDVSATQEKTLEANISMRRSYEAFMFPKGDLIGFRTGSLLKNGNDFYLISDSKLRKFSDFSIVYTLSYSKDAFKEVSSAELNYNEKGDDIISTQDYPEDTLFRIEENYYILKNGSLQKFVSDQAFLTRYDSSQAIAKDSLFFDKYPLSEELIGFADGTLVSNADSVFIVSENQIWPIDNPDTFLKKGYQWGNVLAIGEDELSIYTRAKLFNITTSHPDGTIFKTDDTNAYYMIKNEQKHWLPSLEIARSWQKKNYIAVSNKAMETSVSCAPKRNFWNKSLFSCDIPLDAFSSFDGFSYEIKIKADTEPFALNLFSVNYIKDINKSNFEKSILGFYNSIRNKYVPVQQ